MKNIIFSNAYQTLPRINRYHTQVRNKILNECNIPLGTFYNWISGVTRVPENQKAKIAQIMGKPVNELFPIETIVFNEPMSFTNQSYRTL